MSCGPAAGIPPYGRAMTPGPHGFHNLKTITGHDSEWRSIEIVESRDAITERPGSDPLTKRERGEGFLVAK